MQKVTFWKNFKDNISIVALFISGCALIISLLSYFQKNGEITLRKMENQPHLAWSFNNGELMLVNDGKPMSEWDIQIETSLIIKIQRDNSLKMVERRIYYPESWYFPNINSSGEIVSLFVTQINVVDIDLKSRILKIGQQIDPQAKVISVEKNSILQIAYNDIYGERHRKYYILDPPEITTTTSELQCERLYNSIIQLRGFDEYSQTDEEIINIWKEDA